MNLRSILATLLFVTAFLSQALGSTYSDTTIYRRYRFCPDSCVTVSETRHIHNCPPCDKGNTKYLHDTLWRYCGGPEMPIYMINNCGGGCDTTHGGGGNGGNGGGNGGGGENNKPDGDYLKRVWEHLLIKLIDLFLDPKVFLTLLGIITGYFGHELKKDGEEEEEYLENTHQRSIFKKIGARYKKTFGTLLEFLAAFLFIIIAYEFLGILAYPIVIIFATAVAGFLIFSAISEWKSTNEKAHDRWLYDNDVRRSNERLEENKALQKQKNKLMQLYIELQANGKMSASTALKIVEKHFIGQDMVFDHYSVYRQTMDFLRELYKLTRVNEGESVISTRDFYERYIDFLREYLSS